MYYQAPWLFGGGFCFSQTFFLGMIYVSFCCRIFLFLKSSFFSSTIYLVVYLEFFLFCEFLPNAFFRFGWCNEGLVLTLFRFNRLVSFCGKLSMILTSMNLYVRH